jgi:hypothetical protein
VRHSNPATQTKAGAANKAADHVKPCIFKYISSVGTEKSYSNQQFSASAHPTYCSVVDLATPAGKALVDAHASKSYELPFGSIMHGTLFRFLLHRPNTKQCCT